MSRKLESIQRIAEIKPIEGADKIETVRVNKRRSRMSKETEHYIDLASLYMNVDPDLPEKEKYKIALDVLKKAILNSDLEITNIEEA